MEVDQLSSQLPLFRSLAQADRIDVLMIDDSVAPLTEWDIHLGVKAPYRTLAQVASNLVY